MEQVAHICKSFCFEPACRDIFSQSIHALLDVLKYTIAAVQTDKNPTALVDGGALYMRHMSVQENVNSNRSMHPVNTVPYYLTPATHQKCLQSRDISHLTRKAIIGTYKRSIL